MSNHLAQCKFSMPLSCSAVAIAVAALPAGSERVRQGKNARAGGGKGSISLTKRKKKVETKTLCKAPSQKPLNHLGSHPWCLLFNSRKSITLTQFPKYHHQQENGA